MNILSTLSNFLAKTVVTADNTWQVLSSATALTVYKAAFWLPIYLVQLTFWLTVSLVCATVRVALSFYDRPQVTEPDQIITQSDELDGIWEFSHFRAEETDAESLVSYTVLMNLLNNLETLDGTVTAHDQPLNSPLSQQFIDWLTFDDEDPVVGGDDWVSPDLDSYEVVDDQPPAMAATIAIPQAVLTVPVDTRSDFLETLTLAYLKPIAKTLMVNTKLKKADMIAAILAAENCGADFE